MTSEYKESDERIVESKLWKIEESFKATKSDLKTRPIYLSREEYIETHFLTCFVSLVIARLLEQRLKEQHSITTILDSLKKASCSHIQENYYLLDFYDEVLEEINKELAIDLGEKCQ